MEDIQKKIVRAVVRDPSPSRDLLIFVATPNTGTVSSMTAQCISDMCLHFTRAGYQNGEKAVIWRGAQCSMLTYGRHRLVQMAGEMQATHMLWVDSDMIFPSDALHALLRHGKHIVGCNYPRKTYPHMPTAAVAENVLLYPEYAEVDGDIDLSKPREELVKVMHLGFGLVLVHMEVYQVMDEKLGQPYFQFEPIFRNGNYMGDFGEDNYFFRRAREAGYDVWCDTVLSNLVKHEGHVEFDLTYSARGHFMEQQDKEQSDGVVQLQRAEG